MKQLYLGLAVALSFPHVASASEQNIERVTVLGSRFATDINELPASVEIFDRNYIDATGAVFISDILRNIAGINLSQSGPQGTLTEVRFRGSESNHLLVLIDGIEINDLGQGGIADFAHIQVSDVERIEVLKGAQSSLWGSNAISGVINIVTKGQRPNAGRQISASSYFGTQNTSQVALSFANQQSDGGYAINLSQYKTDGFNIARESSENSNREEDGYDNTTLSASYRLRVNRDHELKLTGRLVRYDSEFDAIDFFTTGLPTDADNKTDGEQINAQLHWRYVNPSALFNHQLQLQANSQEVENFSDDTFTGSTKGEKTRLNWITTAKINESDFINVGFDFVDERFQQKGPIVFGDPNQKQKNVTKSVTADGRVYLLPTTNLSASLRYDNSDEFDNATSYRVGLNTQVNDAFRAFVASGKAIKNPTFTERFGFFPDTFLGNPNLKPESQIKHEAGVSITGEVSEVSIVYFNSQLEDEIDGFVFDPATGSFTAGNKAGKSNRDGVEFNALLDLDNVKLRMSYAYLDAEDETAKELRRANHSGSLSAVYTLGQSHVLYAQANYTGTRLDQYFPPFPQSSQIVALNAYWLVNAHYQFKLNESMSFSIKASNLTDEDYEDVFGFVGQGRQILAGFNYTL